MVEKFLKLIDAKNTLLGVGASSVIALTCLYVDVQLLKHDAVSRDELVREISTMQSWMERMEHRLELLENKE